MVQEGNAKETMLQDVEGDLNKMQEKVFIEKI